MYNAGFSPFASSEAFVETCCRSTGPNLVPSLCVWDRRSPGDKRCRVPSRYLTSLSDFENAINRNMLHTRSKELTTLVGAVREYYIGNKTEQLLRYVEWAWNDWRSTNPKEFAKRAQVPLHPPNQITLEQEFEAELETQRAIAREGEGEAFPAPPGDVPNRHQWLLGEGAAVVSLVGDDVKRAGKLTLASAGPVASAVGHHFSTPTLLAVAAGTATVGTGGAALLAVGPVATAIQSGLAIKSYLKTQHHIKELQDLYEHRGAFVAECRLITRDGVVNTDEFARRSHDIVANHVLPYAISQKSKKAGRKLTSAVPVFGLQETVRAVTHKLDKKFFTHDLGTRRQSASRWLAAHLLTCQCTLATAMVSDLIGPDYTDALLRSGTIDEISSELAKKMKST